MRNALPVPDGPTAFIDKLQCNRSGAKVLQTIKYLLITGIRYKVVIGNRYRVIIGNRNRNIGIIVTQEHRYISAR